LYAYAIELVQLVRAILTEKIRHWHWRWRRSRSRRSSSLRRSGSFLFPINLSLYIHLDALFGSVTIFSDLCTLLLGVLANFLRGRPIDRKVRLIWCSCRLFNRRTIYGTV